MSVGLRRKLRTRRAQVVATALIAALVLSVGMAHSATGSDHMGNAVVVCLAIGIATAAVAAAPGLGRQLPPRGRPPQRTGSHAISVVPALVPSQCARGHPSHLQVFKR